MLKSGNITSCYIWKYNRRRSFLGGIIFMNTVFNCVRLINNVPCCSRTHDGRTQTNQPDAAKIGRAPHP